MARGYPDFFGYSVFPFWGVNHSQEALVALIASGATETEFSLPYKGVIRGGFLSFSLGSGPGFISVSVTVDGDNIFTLTVEYLKTKNLIRPGNNLIFLELYDPDALLFTLGFTPDISFGQEYLLSVQNTGAIGLDVAGELLYTRII